MLCFAASVCQIDDQIQVYACARALSVVIAPYVEAAYVALQAAVSFGATPIRRAKSANLAWGAQELDQQCYFLSMCPGYLRNL